MELPGVFARALVRWEVSATALHFIIRCSRYVAEVQLEDLGLLARLRYSSTLLPTHCQSYIHKERDEDHTCVFILIVEFFGQVNIFVAIHVRISKE